MFFPAESVGLFFCLTFLSSCLKWELMLCYRKLHMLSPLQCVHFWCVFSVLGWPPWTFASATALWSLGCCLVPASLYLGWEVVVTVISLLQFLLNASWKAMGDFWIFIFLFFESSVDMAVSPCSIEARYPWALGVGEIFLHVCVT